MTKFFETYVYLIIATLSLIAPLISYLLSVEGIELLDQIFFEKERQIARMMRRSVVEDNPEIRTSIIQFEKMIANNLNANRRLIKLLNPKLQMIKIFSSLIFSLIFQMFYYLANDNILFPELNPLWLVLLFIISLCFFVCGIYIIGQVSWAMIDAKKIINNLKAGEGVDSI
jgi:hypothetical protein